MIGWELEVLEAEEPSELPVKFAEWQAGKNVEILALQYGESAMQALVRTVAEERKMKLIKHCTLLVFYKFTEET